MDALDDSNQKLSFGSSGDTRNVKLFDDNATGGICLTGGGPATARGIGVVDGDTINVTFDVECADGGSASGIVLQFVYDPATNTLSDTAGGPTTTWYRQGG